MKVKIIDIIAILFMTAFVFGIGYDNATPHALACRAAGGTMSVFEGCQKIVVTMTPLTVTP